MDQLLDVNIQELQSREQTLKTLDELWNATDKKSGLKFRFVDWNHKTRYFIVAKQSPDGSHLEGELDCGTKISFPVSSDFWVDYHEGDEFSPRAV